MDPVSTDLPWAPSIVRVGRAKLEFAFHKCSAPSWHAARAVQYRHARKTEEGRTPRDHVAIIRVSAVRDFGASAALL
jgi:hypothetical protein